MNAMKMAQAKNDDKIKNVLEIQGSVCCIRLVHGIFWYVQCTASNAIKITSERLVAVTMVPKGYS